MGWQLDVAVSDAAGVPVGGAKVQAFDVQRNRVFEAITGPDGHIPAQEVMQYSRAGTTSISHTPHMLQVTADGMTAGQQVTIDAEKAITLTMHPIGREALPQGSGSLR